ncbi:hypothetical protein [Microbacterium oxydans]|uniref:hypothetical protein n=1 Tax=Microbacterium oxydans TaxID=82380 RepID=UPI0037C7351A
MTSFGELVDSLRGSGFSGSATEAFAIPTESGFFVDPVLVPKDGMSNLGADIILVSARGAAGKSRTAAELALRLEAPLWRLEKDAAVGKAALPLALNSYLGTVDALSVLGEREQAALLIDSLDEARARVSPQSWDEFLEAISDAAARGLTMVLFGRDRTLEEVWLKLTDEGRSIAWLEVSHFPATSQKRYIDGRVQERDASASISGAYYEAARDALLAALAGSVNDGSAETFVGYAPVLDAVATVLLDEQNHYKLAQEFAAKTGGSRHIEVLRDILYELLKREQGKLSQLAADLGLDPNVAYTPQEQVDWLWHDIAGTPEPALSAINDPAREFEYRKQLRSFLEQHPFRSERQWASVVFQAYAAADRLDGDLPANVLLAVGNSSGLLFDLVSAAANGARMILDETQFAALHSSIVAGESVGSAATVTAADSADIGLTGRMEVTRPSGQVSLEFMLIPADAAYVALSGPLESLTVSTEGGVRITSLDSGRMIGPDLFLKCESLRIDGNEARFARTTSSGSDETTDVRFEVAGAELTLPPIISVSPPVDAFELAVLDNVPLVFPWIEYRASLENDEAIDPQSRSIRFLSKLQNLARTHGHDDGRATFFMKLQGRQPIKADKLRAVLTFLERKGTVRLQGDLVFLTSEADEHRFSGKARPGQRTIQDEWEYWGPIVEGLESVLALK